MVGLMAQAALYIPLPDSLESESIIGGAHLLPPRGENTNPLHPSRQYSLPLPGSILWSL